MGAGDSGRTPLVTVVKAIDFRGSDDATEFRRLHRPHLRRVLAESQMRSTSMIIGGERFHLPVQGGLVEDNHLIEALAANCPNHPLQ